MTGFLEKLANFNNRVTSVQNSVNRSRAEHYRSLQYDLREARIESQIAEAQAKRDVYQGRYSDLQSGASSLLDRRLGSYGVQVPQTTYMSTGGAQFAYAGGMPGVQYAPQFAPQGSAPYGDDGPPNYYGQVPPQNVAARPPIGGQYLPPQQGYGAGQPGPGAEVDPNAEQDVAETGVGARRRIMGRQPMDRRQQPAAEAPAPDAAPAEQAAPEAPAATLNKSTGARAKRYGLRDQMPPELNLGQDQVEALQSLMSQKDDLKGLMATRSHPDGVDGKFGPNTYKALQTIAAEAQVDLAKVNFREGTGEEYTKFMTALSNHGRSAERAAPEAGAQPEQQPQQDPAEAQRAERQAQRQAQQEERQAQLQAMEANDAPILRGTEYGTARLSQMGGQERYALARKTLLAIGELKDEGKQHNLENMHDKLKEAVRDANERFGTRFREPTQDQPFTNEAMQALALVAADKGKLGSNLAAAAYDRRSANRAADTMLDALDVDGAGSSRSRVANFERSAGMPADGRVDPNMLRAAQAMYAQKIGLGSLGVVGEMPEPAPDQRTQAADARLAASVSGGQDAGPAGQTVTAQTAGSKPQVMAIGGPRG